LPRTSSRTSSDRPLEFFFDRSLGKISAQRLRDAGHTVHLIADFYPDDAQQVGDSEWIAEGCRRGWTLLTKDQLIRYRTYELAALDSGHLFCLADGNATLDIIAQRFCLQVRLLPSPRPTRPSPGATDRRRHSLREPAGS
jgi:hypothetical protein